MLQGQVLQVLQSAQTQTTNSIHVRDCHHSSSSCVQASGFHPAILEMRAEKKILAPLDCSCSRSPPYLAPWPQVYPQKCPVATRSMFRQTLHAHFRRLFL